MDCSKNIIQPLENANPLDSDDRQSNDRPQTGDALQIEIPTVHKSDEREYCEQWFSLRATQFVNQCS